jgi:hypothetical protein
MQKGASQQLTEKRRRAKRGRTGPERAWLVGPGRSAQANRSGLFWDQFTTPFDLGVSL